MTHWISEDVFWPWPMPGKHLGSQYFYPNTKSQVPKFQKYTPCPKQTSQCGMCSMDLGKSNGIVFAEFQCVVDEI